jgi:hypothetical protein
MLLNSTKASSLPALFLTVVLGALPMAQADDGWGQDGASPATPGESAGPIAVSDGDLDKVASVNVKAQEIQQKYEAQVQGAKTMNDIERIQQQMEGELIDAIHEQDISLQEYQQVALAVERDPGLRARFEAMVMEKAQAK